MSSWHRAALAFVTITTTAATAFAEEGGMTGPNMGGETPPPTTPEDEEKKKEPKRGDFNAGGQVRLPNGPDEMGEYATFNWVALDVKGKYYLLDTVTVNGDIPLAIIKPGTLMTGEDPSMIGGISITLDAKLPRTRFAPKATEGSEVGVLLSGAVMREGAMLLSEKDYPLFHGSFKPGFTSGLKVKAKVSSLLDFSLVPVFVMQAGSEDSAMAVQIPMSLIVKLGSVLKVSADLGVYTGDDFTFRSSKGGRVAAGGAVDFKIGPIVTHLGAGAASLGTGPGEMYPTIRDAVYIDVNVKYVK